MNAKVSLNLQRGYTAKDIAFIESTRPEGGGWRLFEYHDDIPKVTWAKIDPGWSDDRQDAHAC